MEFRDPYNQSKKILLPPLMFEATRMVTLPTARSRSDLGQWDMETLRKRRRAISRRKPRGLHLKWIHSSNTRIKLRPLSTTVFVLDLDKRRRPRSSYFLRPASTPVAADMRLRQATRLSQVSSSANRLLISTIAIPSPSRRGPSKYPYAAQRRRIFSPRRVVWCDERRRCWRGGGISFSFAQ